MITRFNCKFTDDEGNVKSEGWKSEQEVVDYFKNPNVGVIISQLEMDGTKYEDDDEEPFWISSDAGEEEFYLSKWPFEDPDDVILIDLSVGEILYALCIYLETGDLLSNEKLKSEELKPYILT